MLDHIMVETADVKVGLNRIAVVSVLDSHTLSVMPYDPSVRTFLPSYKQFINWYILISVGAFYIGALNVIVSCKFLCFGVQEKICMIYLVLNLKDELFIAHCSPFY
jgi:hypothetical protein